MYKESIDFNALTKADKNKCIARLNGWKERIVGEPSPAFNYAVWDNSPYFGCDHVPNYVGDLNEMFRLEQTLSKKQSSYFAGVLVNICGSVEEALRADAEERAEAYWVTKKRIDQ